MDVRWRVYYADKLGKAMTEGGTLGIVVAPDVETARRRARALYGPGTTAVSDLEAQATNVEVGGALTTPRAGRRLTVGLTRAEREAWAEAEADYKRWLAQQQSSLSISVSPRPRQGVPPAVRPAAEGERGVSGCAENNGDHT